MVTNISQIDIQAAPGRVWDVLTQPALVKAWQFGSELRTAWAPGSDIRFVTPWEGQVFEQWGVVQEFHPCQQLAYSLFAPRPGLDDSPGNYFLMTYVLEPTDSGTRLRIIQEDPRPGAVQKEPEGPENPVLQALKTIAETR